MYADIALAQQLHRDRAAEFAANADRARLRTERSARPARRVAKTVRFSWLPARLTRIATR